jgi:transposase
LIHGAGGVSAIEITRQDLSISQLRAEAARTADAKQARRLLAIAMVLDGHSRLVAARRPVPWTGKRCVIGRKPAKGSSWRSQLEWLAEGIRYNADGLASFSDRPRPGRQPRLAEAQRSEVAKWVETALTSRPMAWCAGAVLTCVTAPPPNSMFICMSAASASC